jgi:hypothetical protein
VPRAASRVSAFEYDLDRPSPSQPCRLGPSPSRSAGDGQPRGKGLEEHHRDPEVRALGAGPGAGREIVERLDDLGALRFREMYEAGIDLQVLSHSIPWLREVDAEAGPPFPSALMTAIRGSAVPSGSFLSHRSVPTANPGAVAGELERAVICHLFLNSLFLQELDKERA